MKPFNFTVIPHNEENFIVFHFKERPSLMTANPVKGIIPSNRQFVLDYYDRFKDQIYIDQNGVEQKFLKIVPRGEGGGYQAILRDYDLRKSFYEKNEKKPMATDSVSELLRKAREQWAIDDANKNKKSGSNWYSLLKKAQIWRTDYEDNLLGHLKKIYELQYKYDVMKNSHFNGHPKRKFNTMEGIRKSIIPSVFNVKDTMITLFSTWLSKHTLTDPAEWARNRMIETDDYDNSQRFEYAINDYQNVADIAGYGSSVPQNNEDCFMSILESMEFRKFDSIELVLNLLLDYEKDQLSDHIKNFEDDPEELEYFSQRLTDIEENGITVQCIYDQCADLSFFQNDEILFDIYENFIFPYWYEYWGAKGIDETRETIENIYQKLTQIDGNDISKDMTTLNLALNATHQSGNMLQYLNQFTDEEEYVSVEDLDKLSNLDDETKKWDDDLRKIGVEIGSPAKVYAKKWGDDYFPKKRDLIDYMPEMRIWTTADYSNTDLVEAIKNPEKRDKFNIPEETWKKLEYNYSQGLSLESNMTLLNIHQIPDKMERKPFPR